MNFKQITCNKTLCMVSLNLCLNLGKLSAFCCVLGLLALSAGIVCMVVSFVLVQIFNYHIDM